MRQPDPFLGCLFVVLTHSFCDALPPLRVEVALQRRPRTAEQAVGPLTLRRRHEFRRRSNRLKAISERWMRIGMRGQLGKCGLIPRLQLVRGNLVNSLCNKTAVRRECGL